MPETTINTRVDGITRYYPAVRSLLKNNPQPLTNIQNHLNLTKAQTLSVLQRLEESQDIYCDQGIWYLR
jgi:predicted Rossmann fold nucleotide-binding protein DprA/Smf involved in DNA uptake